MPICTFFFNSCNKTVFLGHNKHGQGGERFKMNEKKKNANKKKQGAPIVRGLVRPMPGGRAAPGYMGIGFDNDSIGRDVLLSDTDPNGSYTGITRDGDDRPVQDADDL